jgi:hypothetical protein
MIKAIRDTVRRWLYEPDKPCPPCPPVPLVPESPPKKLREADHLLRNEVAGLDAVIHRLQRDYDDPLGELVRRISQENREEHGPTSH